MKIRAIQKFTQVEEFELQQCEKIIEENLAAFLLVGMALMTIQSKRLYRKTHHNFETYVNERWKLSKPYAYRLVAASRAFENIKKMVPTGDKVKLPEMEVQLRYLTHLSPEKQGMVWVEALQIANGKQPTADQIKAIVEKMSSEEKKMVLNLSKEIREEQSEEIREERFEHIKTTFKKNPKLKAEEKFSVLLIDPPWQYSFERSENRKIENKYPTMPIEHLMRLKIPAADDAVIFLWATSPKLAEAMTLLEAWGFEYKTSAVWVKDKIGMGYYFRSQHELLFVATKGNLPVPAPSNRVSSVITADRTRHSVKPVDMYGMIEKMYPDLPKIELFARNKRSGWSSWGNERI